MEGESHTMLAVEDVVHEFPPDAQPVVESAQKDEEVIQSAEATRTANTLMLRRGISTLGGVLESFSGVPGAAFSEQEEEALVEVWGPLLNVELTPVYLAAIVTLIIVGGKVGKIAAYKRAHRLAAGQPGKTAEQHNAA